MSLKNIKAKPNRSGCCQINSNAETMECRLCLGSAPAESFVSIFGDPHPEFLEQRIRTCCQIQVQRGDGLPDTVCLSCKTNLELLISFRKACFRSYETSQLRITRMEETFEFTKGQTFKDYECVKQYFYKFCQQNYHPFVVNCHNSKQIIYVCCHGVQRKSKCEGKRPHQNYLYKGCPAKINMYKSKDNLWKVTNVRLAHNHTIGKEEFKLYRRNSTLTVESLANAKDSTIAEILEKKNDSRVTRKDVQNIRNKIFPECSEENRIVLLDFLNKLEEDGGRSKVTFCQDGKVQTIFLTSDVMISNFRKSSPSVIQIDISFGFNAENYKMMGFCYYSPITGKTEFASIAFISIESLINLKECIKEFQTICTNIPKIFMIDKDFTEISAIKNVFPTSHILLCKFHIIKYIKKVLSTALCDVVEKRNLLQLFKKVLFSQTSEEYINHTHTFLNNIGEIEICSQNKRISFIQYYNKNWDTCKEMWVHSYRKHLPLMGDTTTNRIERSFWTLKNHMKTKLRSVPSIAICIIELVTFISERIKTSNTVMAQKVNRIMDPNPETRHLLHIASNKLTEGGMKLYHRSLKLLLIYKGNISIKENGEVCENFKDGTNKIYYTSSENCSCSFWKQYNVPCRHILFVRTERKIDTFPECFHNRYLKQDNIDEQIDLNSDSDKFSSSDDDSQTDQHEKPLTPNEKFNIVHNSLKDLADIISNHGTPSFLKYVDELNVIKDNARNGLSLLNQNVNSSKTILEENTQSEELENNTINKPNTYLIKCKGRPKRKTKQTSFNRK
ncbi:uncharacterized protein LOC143919071 [Arctopsyche grandis]|uniref:uncharacterized protein LOC143919071 n=1 Tax=Arctopsyche grandis TaxID=121162 RepID=UPI00406D9419